MLRFKSLLCSSLMFVLFMSACSAPSDIAVEYVDVNGDKIPKILVEKITDQTEINFTDWFEDIQLINLESTEESLVRRVMRSYIGEEYILISTVGKGILMFSRSGEFIRAVASHGNGPGEVIDANRNIFVDEKNSKLYATDMMKHRDKVVCIDLISGSNVYIPLKYTGGAIIVRDIFVLDDSLMYCSTMHSPGRPSNNPVFCQTTSGKLLWEIEKSPPEGTADGSIRLSDGNIIFNYTFITDTIYQVKNQELSPLIILSSERPGAFLVKDEGSIYMGLRQVNSDWFIGNYIIVKDVVFDEQIGRERNVFSERKEFVFNLSTGQAKNIESIKNDYLGWDEDFDLQFHHNGIGVVSYQAIDLLEKADSVIKLPNISKKLKNRLEHILQTVDENDNPYLLVGRLKATL